MFGKHSFDLEKQFTFYASYHNNPLNVLIHLLCIWPILATALVLLQYTPELTVAPDFFTAVPNGQYFKVNVALIVTLIYVVCYIVMEPFAGLIGAGLVTALYVHSAKMVGLNTMFNGYEIWQVALTIHVFAWILQFIGHGLFEGRAPALIDSWDQALLTAPLFVLLEILFFFGYRRAFHDKIMAQVEINIKQFKEQKSK